jgi:hypothetical protein
MRVIILGVMLDRQMNLAKALSRKDEVAVAVPPFELSGVVQSAEGEFELCPFGWWSSTSHLAVFLLVLRTWKRFRKFDPVVVHVELGGSIIYFAFLLCSRRYSLAATFQDVSLQTGERFFSFRDCSKCCEVS